MKLELLEETLLKIQNGVLGEAIDFEGTFSDVDKKCISEEELLIIMNDEMDRFAINTNLKPKDREKRNRKNPLLSKNITKKVSEGIMNFAEEISKPPKNIFGEPNQKLQKTAGVDYYTVNTGLPALKAFVYDRDTGKFYILNTCPYAGSCQLYCYALKGTFQFDGSILNMHRKINLLMNDPKRYERMAFANLLGMAEEANGDGKQLRIRWNDSGDFFTKKYYDIARSVTDRLLEMDYDVLSYAYTKSSEFYYKSTNTFIMNFSDGAKVSETNKVDLGNEKTSFVVDREMTKDLNLTSNSTKDRQKIKEVIASNYDTTVERLKFDDELPDKEGSKYQYDAVVRPANNKGKNKFGGDTDLSAQREDVRATYLLIH